MLLQQYPSLTPDQVKAALVNTGLKLKTRKGEVLETGMKSIDLHRAADKVHEVLENKIVSTQNFAPATGLGTLEGARGSEHVSDGETTLAVRSMSPVLHGTSRSWRNASWNSRSWRTDDWLSRSWRTDGWTSRSWRTERLVIAKLAHRRLDVAQLAWFRLVGCRVRRQRSPRVVDLDDGCRARGRNDETASRGRSARGHRVVVGMLAAAALLSAALRDTLWQSSTNNRINPVVMTALVADSGAVRGAHSLSARDAHVFIARDTVRCRPVPRDARYVADRVRRRRRRSARRTAPANRDQAPLQSSLLAFEVVVGICTYLLFVGRPDLHSPRTWIAAATAAVALDALGGMLVTLAIVLHEGGGVDSTVGWLMLTGAVAAVANASFALISVMVLGYSPVAAVLVSVLGATLLVAYRSYASLRRHYSHLVSLRGYTESLGTATALEDVASQPCGRHVTCSKVVGPSCGTSRRQKVTIKCCTSRCTATTSRSNGRPRVSMTRRRRCGRRCHQRNAVSW